MMGAIIGDISILCPIPTAPLLNWSATKRGTPWRPRRFVPRVLHYRKAKEILALNRDFFEKVAASLGC